MKNLDGLLVVAKPRGLVSKDVSRWLTKRLGKNLRLGHVGTLDPGAEGVLPILFGRATKLQDYLLDFPKTYEFDMVFGQETDTLDLDGTVVRTAPAEHVTKELIEAALPSLRGEIEQVPPLYSAVKFQGKPLYEYARKDQGDAVPVEQLKRKVRVERFEMLSYEDGKGTFIVTCSKGTYVRTLVKDLAEMLGSCGTLARLVRTQAAGVSLDKSYSIEALEQLLAENAGSIASAVVPLGDIQLGLPRWTASREAAQRLRSGQQLALSEGEYLSGLDLAEKRPVPLTTWATPLALCDESGQAFGIGSVRSHQPAREVTRVLINMKRGL